MLLRLGQVYSAVQELLPEVAYNAPARILTLRTSGARKQPRLPGAHRVVVGGSPVPGLGLRPCWLNKSLVHHRLVPQSASPDGAQGCLLPPQQGVLSLC